MDHRQENHPAMGREEQLENDFTVGGAVVTEGQGGKRQLHLCRGRRPSGKADGRGWGDSSYLLGLLPRRDREQVGRGMGRDAIDDRDEEQWQINGPVLAAHVERFTRRRHT